MGKYTVIEYTSQNGINAIVVDRPISEGKFVQVKLWRKFKIAGDTLVLTGDALYCAKRFNHSIFIFDEFCKCVGTPIAKGMEEKVTKHNLTNNPGGCILTFENKPKSQYAGVLLKNVPTFGKSNLFITNNKTIRPGDVVYIEPVDACGKCKPMDPTKQKMMIFVPALILVIGLLILTTRKK